MTNVNNRLKLGFAEDDDHARYDLHRLCTDFRYAQKADYSSTPNVLPETAETWSIHGAFDHPGQTFGPVDLDSIMMYGTVSFDPGVFTFTDGRSIKRNDMPSVIDLDRVAAMYGTKVRNENGEWVYEHNGVLAQAGRVQVPEGMQDMAKSALQLIENLDTDMPDAGAEASSAQEQIAEAIRKPSKDASARP